MRIDFSLKGDALLQELSKALQNRLTFNENIQSSVVVVPDTGLANSGFVVEHNLGKVPTGYIANVDRAGIVYDFNRNLWSATQMQLKCSVANTALKLIVF